MSTNIHNGWKCSKPIYEFYKDLIDLKPKFKDLSLTLLHREVALLAAKEIDGIRHNNRECEKEWTVRDVLNSHASQVLDDLRKAEKEQSRRPTLDMDCQIFMFPREDHTLFMTVGEPKQYTDLIAQMPGVTHHPYWDSVDPPKDMTEAQWKEREEDWDIALSESGMPIEKCLTFSLTNTVWFRLGRASQIIEQMPPIEDRVHHLARITYVNDNWSEDQEYHQVAEHISAYANDPDIQSEYMRKVRPSVVPLALDHLVNTN